jgi:hypothetical protein
MESVQREGKSLSLAMDQHSVSHLDGGIDRALMSCENNWRSLSDLLNQALPDGSEHWIQTLLKRTVRLLMDEVHAFVSRRQQHSNELCG